MLFLFHALVIPPLSELGLDFVLLESPATLLGATFFLNFAIHYQALRIEWSLMQSLLLFL